MNNQTQEESTFELGLDNIRWKKTTKINDFVNLSLRIANYDGGEYRLRTIWFVVRKRAHQPNLTVDEMKIMLDVIIKAYKKLEEIVNTDNEKIL